MKSESIHRGEGNRHNWNKGELPLKIDGSRLSRGEQAWMEVKKNNYRKGE